MALFGFGAFSTPVGSLIEQATDNSASAGNIALHLQICDAVNDNDAGPKEAVAAIRRRLTGNAKNFHIINLTLTVLETCVKNCGIRFHTKIAQKDFLKDLMSVIYAKNNPPTIVCERILGLIQYWTDAFKNKPQLSAVQELYEQLKDEGTEFPPLDLDSLTPVDTLNRGGTRTAGRAQLELVQPGGGSNTSGQIRSRSSQRPVGPLKPEQIAKLLSELDVVRRNLDVMNEILVENEPGKEKEDDLTLMQELNTTLRAMQERATMLIGRIADEIVLESLLQINDELNTSFTRYDRHMKNRQAVLQQPQQVSEDNVTPLFVPLTSDPQDTSLPEITYPSLDLPPSYEESGGDTAVGQLIDLGIELDPISNGGQVPPSQQNEGGGDIVTQLAQLGITTETNKQEELTTSDQDDFDMFAQSRIAYSTGGSTYDDIMHQGQGISISSALHRQPQPPPPTDSRYENLQTWLSEAGDPPNPQTQQTIDDQVTSQEFDQFLAQRAGKGRHRPQMQQQEEKSDELFQL